MYRNVAWLIPSLHQWVLYDAGLFLKGNCVISYRYQEGGYAARRMRCSMDRPDLIEIENNHVKDFTNSTKWNISQKSRTLLASLHCLITLL
jgi:hypothetical protein